MERTATARIDIQRLQLLNDRLLQCLDALNQVRYSIHATETVDPRMTGNFIPAYGQQQQLPVYGYGYQQPVMNYGFRPSFVGQTFNHGFVPRMDIPVSQNFGGLWNEPVVDTRIERTRPTYAASPVAPAIW